jgi:hypothetical protein
MYKAPLKGDTSVTKAILPGGLMISGALPSGEPSGGPSVRGPLALPH